MVFWNKKTSEPEITDINAVYVVKESERLRSQNHELMRHQRELEALKVIAMATTDTVSPKLNRFKTSLSREIHSAITGMKQFRIRKINGSVAFREFQHNEDITRPVHIPDLFSTGLIIGSCWLLEGGVSTGLFMADGIELIPAMATGFAVAGVNLITSCTMGFFGLRYFVHKIKQIRFAAYGGFGIGVLMLGLLHFGAARSRVMGGHGDIFDFSEIGVFSTFGDYFAMALFVLGVISSVIAIYKGLHGFADCYPEYQKIFEDTHQAIDNAAEDFYATSSETIEEAFNKASDELTEAYEQSSTARKAYATAWHNLQNAIASNNAEIDRTVTRIDAVLHDDAIRESFIHQHAVTVNERHSTLLNTFKVTPLTGQPDVIPDPVDIQALQSELQEIYVSGALALDNSFNDFHTPVEDFSFTNNPYTSITLGENNETIN